jgi:lipoprotein-anchoring transpeptidase ErfK/SrfK
VSGKRASHFRVIIASGVLAMALLALVACATTTSPVSRPVDPAFARKVVAYPSPAPPGTVIVDPGSHFLYLVQGGGQAIRYGVGWRGRIWVGGFGYHSHQTRMAGLVPTRRNATAET